MKKYIYITMDIARAFLCGNRRGNLGCFFSVIPREVGIQTVFFVIPVKTGIQFLRFS